MSVLDLSVVRVGGVTCWYKFIDSSMSLYFRVSGFSGLSMSMFMSPSDNEKAVPKHTQLTEQVFRSVQLSLEIRYALGSVDYSQQHFTVFVAALNHLGKRLFNMGKVVLFAEKVLLFGQKVVVFGQSVCIWANWLYLGKVVLFGRIGSIWAKGGSI